MKITTAAIMFLLLLLPLSFTLLTIQQQAIALRVLGQQYFANGTGTVYFDDGTTSHFNHTITPERGYFYDNSTAFPVGTVPGISSGDGVKCAYNDGNDIPDYIPAIGNTTTLTVVNGASFLNGSRAIEPPTPVIKIKAGDIVTWVNEDFYYPDLTSPPSGEVTPGLQTFDVFLSERQQRAFSCAFLEPGGFHYSISIGGSAGTIKGAVIVEE